MVLPPVIFAALAGVFFWGMQRQDPDALPSAIAGKPAPGVQLTQLADYPSFDDATLRDGKVKLVNFFASWCAPCRVEHPNLEAIAERGEVPIYGVNYKDEPAKATAFLEELGNPYSKLGADAKGQMALNWGLYGVPETYVIDGQGKVILRFAGPITERVLNETIRPAIEKAKAETR
ncbi:DsbE family thiol:disulfide interchange protein [Pseudooceanicola sp. CBS1P-1]|uniref:DsbE family thiol:disulfide interchange protein n=1 Tax=Pseudooceanicola albus TaxID=2692189 RepID=A0A6L7FXH6_9RHOB|nr:MULTISPECIES: DsbE family thiol:disulfide interchange protein [Pseudooceanicola]MBT9382271.1 DsbE family thiol:disulfide interchange protein [Pseudooceanicola endophyticus]MXN16814.1 DsbE family thiol:disulfide interchange protein [Pseudooceanicola albus]